MTASVALSATLAGGFWWHDQYGRTRLTHDRVWRIGYNQTEPFHFRDAKGQAAGFAKEVLDAAAAQQGIRLRWVFVPHGAYRAFTEQAIDLFPRTVNVPGINRAAYITQPWFESHYGLVQGGAAAPGASRRIATGPAPFLREFGAQRMPGTVIEPADSWTQAVARLCRGEVGGVFAELREATLVLVNRPEECKGLPLRLKALPGAILPAGIGSTREAAPVADALRNGLSELADDGRLASVHSKWYLELPYGVTSVEAAVRASRERRELLMTIAGAIALCVTAWVVALRMRSLRRDALRAAEVKCLFMATISHELRTPLNGVLGMTQLLKHTRLDGEQSQMVDTIAGSGESLLRLINDVLDFARLDTGKLVLAGEAFDLRASLGKTIDLLEPVAREKRLELQLQIHRDLPRRVRGDEHRLRQVLLNLVGNALKFTAEGSVLVEVSPGQRHGEVWFVVSDTGIGIHAEVLPTLFDPFVQADSTPTRPYGGTGLGLAISKKLVQAMGGAIGLESEAGRGTRCWFHLPLEPLPDAGESAVTRPRPLRILLAEDNPVNQTVARRLLEQRGHEVHVVANGRLALDALSQGAWDLVLMDCQMPEMDGYAAARQIRQMEATLERRTPIVALTAHAMSDDRERCLNAGMDAYLPKPLRVEELDDLLGRLVTAA